MPVAVPAVERVLRRCVPANGGCIVYVGGLSAGGYGFVVVGSRSDGSRRQQAVHRVVYESMVGPIGDGLDLDHTCETRSCVRPDHLEAVTHQENVRRSAERGRMREGSANAKKQVCAAGHPYDEANTYRRPDGGRNCRECGRLGYHKKTGDIPHKERDPGPAIRAAAAARKARTHCKSGHEFSAENVRMVGGARICRACARERTAALRARKRAG